MSLSAPVFTLPLLCLAALLAGLVDGMVGGGGLMQLPARLALRRGTGFVRGCFWWS